MKVTVKLVVMMVTVTEGVKGHNTVMGFSTLQTVSVNLIIRKQDQFGSDFHIFRLVMIKQIGMPG